ncbi:hypothetical protein PVAP13_6NG036066 [Panicum virgatum]|uniref:Uncharacterized protein n=1 Tax=Panicum virgatum TaxID=38727 RepID=A0A8T0QTZ4_PANVG|nr:hypothetical protein PVAP13_6NG036066 [Panicum virgatum]
MVLFIYCSHLYYAITSIHSRSDGSHPFHLSLQYFESTAEDLNPLAHSFRKIRGAAGKLSTSCTSSIPPSPSSAPSSPSQVPLRSRLGLAAARYASGRGRRPAGPPAEGIPARSSAHARPGLAEATAWRGHRRGECRRGRRCTIPHGLQGSGKRRRRAALVRWKIQSDRIVEPRHYSNPTISLSHPHLSPTAAAAASPSTGERRDLSPPPCSLPAPPTPLRPPVGGAEDGRRRRGAAASSGRSRPYAEAEARPGGAEARCGRGLRAAPCCPAALPSLRPSPLSLSLSLSLSPYLSLSCAGRIRLRGAATRQLELGPACRAAAAGSRACGGARRMVAGRRRGVRRRSARGREERAWPAAGRWSPDRRPRFFL